MGPGMMPDHAESSPDMDHPTRNAAFRALHASGCFVIPNPWDAGSARWLRAQGFKAMASTSAGFAFTQGRADQDVPLAMMLAHLGEMVAAVPDIPLNADFENGYADDPEGVARNVTACVATGVAGLSIEDATGRVEDPLYAFSHAIERVQAARAAIDAGGSRVLLTARAEGMLVHGASGRDEALRRIEAFVKAGADVVYAPGLRTRDDIGAMVTAAAGKPVNMLMSGNFGHNVSDLAGLGVRRISVGAAMVRAAWAGFIKATELIARDGSFAGFAENAVTAPLNHFFRADLRDRSPDEAKAQ
jgi:2-methylisocitrate lyase-like PEP mutase family enzyme